MDNNATPNPSDPIERLQRGLEKADAALNRTIGEVAPEDATPEGARSGDPADILDTYENDHLTNKDFAQEPTPLYGDATNAYNVIAVLPQDELTPLETEGGTSGGSSGGASADLQDALSDGNSGGLTGDDDSDARVHARRQDSSNPRADDATRLGN